MLRSTLASTTNGAEAAGCLVIRPESCWTGLMTTPSPAAGGSARNGRLKAVLRRWRRQRQLRHADSLERKVRARENLRNYKHYTGDEPGPPLGGF